MVEELLEELRFVWGEGYFLLDGIGVFYEFLFYVSDFFIGEIVEEVGGIVEICVIMEYSWFFDLDIFL